MDWLIHAYDIFIGRFPVQYQGIISLGILIIFIITLVQLVRKNFLWILLLVILLPASIPLLAKIGQGIVIFLKYIVTKV